MNEFLLRIVRVDMNGYLGRENHPEPSDVGLVVMPLSMNVWHADPDGEEPMTLLVSGNGVCADVKKAADAENHEVHWITVTRDGRTLDLMGHEVELVSLQEG